MRSQVPRPTCKMLACGSRFHIYICDTSSLPYASAALSPSAGALRSLGLREELVESPAHIQDISFNHYYDHYCYLLVESPAHIQDISLGLRDGGLESRV